MEHPCKGCTAKPVDHAIICPALGRIASGRHKRVRAMTPDRAWEKLYGIERGAYNKATTIKLRSVYFNSDSFLIFHKGVKADGNGTILLARRKRTQGELPLEARLQAASSGLGLGDATGGR